MAFKLTIEQGKDRGQVREFNGPEVTIGRTGESDLTIAEAGVSRQHARITFDGARWVLSDMGSANGTLLNGAKVASEPLENGDRIGIAGAVLVFELAAQTGGNATRIVSLDQAERELAQRASARPAPAQSRSPGSGASSVTASPAGPSLLKGKTNAIILGVAVLVLALAAYKLLGKSSSAGGNVCPKSIELSYVEGATFGRGVEFDCEAPTAGLRINFQAEAGRRYLLRYAPFAVRAGELHVLANGKKVDDAPASAGDKQGALTQTVVLPDALIKSGGRNEIAFQNTRGADEDWGVWRIEVESVALSEATQDKALDHYKLGNKLYHDKQVAAPNLYNAWIELRESRRIMEGLDAKPEFYKATVQSLRDIERELDALCKRKKFSALKDGRYGNYTAANEAYRFLLAAFPGNAHPCRADAEGGMYEEQQAAE